MFLDADAPTAIMVTSLLFAVGQTTARFELMHGNHADFRADCSRSTCSSGSPTHRNELNPIVSRGLAVTTWPRPETPA
jgi:hypothetical protein